MKVAFSFDQDASYSAQGMRSRLGFGQSPFVEFIAPIVHAWVSGNRHAEEDETNCA